MATFPQSTIEKGSDMVQNFLCSTCEDENLDEMADYYCESCVKFYCSKCILMHGQLFKKHFPHGRGDMKKWPVAKKVEDFLLKCDVHTEENLKMFCEDHSQLCCTNCAFLNHRQCKMVVLLSDLVKKKSTDLKKLSESIQTILGEIKNLQNQQEASIQSVQSSYHEQLQKIQKTRRKINTALDLLEKNTLKEMEDALTKLQASLRGDVDKCASLHNALVQLQDAIQDICDKSMLELSFVASIKCQEKIKQSETYLKKNFDQVKSSIAFQPYSDIVQYLSQFSGLGKIEYPDQVIKLKGKSNYDMRIQSDSNTCCITIICSLSNKQVLVADWFNRKLKLLDQQYQVVNHCDVSNWPENMCQVSPSEVAMTVKYKGNNHQLLFMKFINNQLVPNRELKLQHPCVGIAHHQGDLFVTSGVALYKYTLSGELVRKLHEDKSDQMAACAVSPTGDKLYVTSDSQHKLLTLAKDGSILASFKDPKLNSPLCVHVTPAGQVLVWGFASHTILQVHSKGSKKLATLDWIRNPCAVCYNSNTASIIVGQFDNNKILVYKVQ